MKIQDLDGYFLSASALNEFKPCSERWFHKYVLDSRPVLDFSGPGLGTGLDIHKHEENFWNGVALKGRKIFTNEKYKTMPLNEIAKNIAKYKYIFVGTHEPWIYTYLFNLSVIDAKRFVDLRRHFQGDLTQVYPYFVPREMEYIQVSNGMKTNLRIDRIQLIPPHFKKYKNKKIAVGIFDYKPGKHIIHRNSEYDAAYGGGFGTQLAFYLDNLEYQLNGEIVTEKFVAGLYYKTGQYIVEKLDLRSLNPLRDLINKFWNTDSFCRRERYPSKHDDCYFCPYRCNCRNTWELWGDYNGETEPLYKHVKACICDKCNKKFRILKRKSVDRTGSPTKESRMCYDCRQEELNKLKNKIKKVK